MRLAFRLLIAALVVLTSTSTFADYNVSVNTVADFPSSYRRLAILPAIAPEGFDALWLEKAVFTKLAQRQVAAIPAEGVRQAIFDLELQEMTPEAIAKLADKIGADAFILPIVGSVSTRSVGSVSTGGASATTAPAGGYWATFASGFGASVARERNTGFVQISIITKEGRVLMKGQGFGESNLRSLKGVVGKIYDQVFDRAFTSQFLRERKAAIAARPTE